MQKFSPHSLHPYYLVTNILCNVCHSESTNGIFWILGRLGHTWPIAESAVRTSQLYDRATHLLSGQKIQMLFLQQLNCHLGGSSTVKKGLQKATHVIKKWTLLVKLPCFSGVLLVSQLPAHHAQPERSCALRKPSQIAAGINYRSRSPFILLCKWGSFRKENAL